MKGFFSSSEISKPKKANASPQCGRCGLYKKCRSPKMEVGGSGEFPIYWLAEAPGATEDKRGTQMCGKGGKYLRRMVNRVTDIDIEDCYKDNAIRCRPTKNRDPKDYEIECCRPNIINSIKEKKPKVIIPMGSYSIASLLGYLREHNVGTISQWRGAAIPDPTLNAWICPTFHFAYVNRESTPKSAKIIMEKDIQRAVSLINKPLPEFKDDTQCVELLKHPEEIKAYLKDILRHPKRFPFVSFDYETTGLKPHRKGHEIVCCAICTEKERAVSFPMSEEILPIFRRFLKNPDVWKVAANLKFEEMWSRVILGTSVMGWLFDTMLASHILDNREGVTSLKHQVYRRYGVADYDSHLKPLLKSKEKNGNAFNEIRQIPLRDLLIYCGLDALYEFRLALDQMQELRPKWIE